MRRVKVGLLAMGLVTAAYGAAQRQRWLPREPEVLAGLVAVLLLGVAVLGGLTVAQVVRGRVPRARGLATLGALLGVVLVGGGGLANWALSVQATVLLFEGEAVPLSPPSHLGAFEAGPLANLAELPAGLRLDRLELAAEGPDDFSPRTLASALTPDGAATSIALTPRQPASFGPLFLHQGAFGFSPRIVLTKGGATIFDEKVPFSTVLEGPGLPRFEGKFTLEKEQLEVAGVVDLSSLDADMKGHATLALEVRRGGLPLGQGQLLPGHFADLEQGYRVGFVDLRRWSEIVVSRRNYRTPMLAGFVLTVASSLAWLAAVLVGRRREP